MRFLISSLSHLFDDAAGHDFHGGIVSGEKTPTGAFPGVGSDGPVFPGRMKDLPPVLQVFGVGVDQFVVNGREDVGPLLVDRYLEAFETRLFGDLFGHVFDDEEKVLLGQPEVVAGPKGRIDPFVQNPRHLFAFPQGSNGPHDVRDVDFHGAEDFTFGAHRANPRPAGGNHFIFWPERDHADDLARVESVDTGCRAGAGTQTAGQADIL